MTVGTTILIALFVFMMYKFSAYASILGPSSTQIIFYNDVLSKYNEYYKFLSPLGRKKFIKRTHRFRSSKNFIGKNGFVVEEKHETLISSADIQITFGLEDYEFNRYQQIMVFPDTFRFLDKDVYYKGLTGIRGSIFLSWPDFEEGYETRVDRLNLGIHEMAHALELNIIFGNDTTEEFAKKYDSFKETSLAEYDRIKNDEDSFLRNYAGKSEREFFAVCIEHFFEEPQEFFLKLPEIYLHLCTLLNQDPLNTHLDYVIEK